MSDVEESQPPSVSIRPVDAADLDALNVFIEPFVTAGRLLPRTRAELQELVSHGFLAEHDGRIVGFAALEIYSRKLAEVRSLAVAPDMQGIGVGKRLVARCVERAKEKEILEVMAITSSEVFFQNCGFDFTLPGEKKALFIQTSSFPPDRGR